MYSDSRVLAKRTISIKILRDKAYGTAETCEYDGYQIAFAINISSLTKKQDQEWVQM